jgi:hypothetical protein
VLEVPQQSNQTGKNRVSSHVLCNHGNEIFIHALNFAGREHFENRPSLELPSGKLNEYRSTVLKFKIR